MTWKTKTYGECHENLGASDEIAHIMTKLLKM